MKVIKILQNTALILNGMVMIQQLVHHVPVVFGDLSIYIFRYTIKFASFYMLSKIDFVCNKYNPLSIKDSERRRRSIYPGYLLRGLNENLKTHILFRKFLLSGINKESLFFIYGDVLEEIGTKRIP